MKSITLFLLIFSNITSAQNKLETIVNDANYNCKKTKNTSFEKLTVTFPLNKTVKVQLVSFEFKNLVIIEDGKEVQQFISDSLPRIGNKIDYKSIKEFKNLELLKIIELSDILYNFNFNTKKERTALGSGCYDPRNAIVFLDDQDNIIECIEICFSCLGYKIFNNSNFGEFCTGKIDLIRNFFFLNGMKYGVLKE
jgi:hypothetical protein